MLPKFPRSSRADVQPLSLCSS